MKKPVLVCDIDDVLFPFVGNIAKYHNEVKGTSLTEKDFLDFNFNEIWGCTEDEAIEVVDGFMEVDHIELVPVEGAKEALQRLKQDFTVVLVTSRNGRFSDNTTKWLQLHLNDLFEDVIFAGNHYDGRGHRTKGEVCRELGAALIIDDQPFNVLSVAQQGIEGILFGEKAWTVMDTLPEPLVKHCKDWTQVQEYIYGEWRSKQLS